MEIEGENIKYIRKVFAEMESKEDLLRLLNYTKTCIYGEDSFPFNMRQLNYYSNPSINPLRYKTFVIKKKSGGDRIIHSPIKSLKYIQICLNNILQCVHTPDINAFGFVMGKSIVDNAKKHVGVRYVYNTDLIDFFPSVPQSRIWSRLQVPPFNLGRSPERIKIAGVIAALCCEKQQTTVWNNKQNEWIEGEQYVLPQGAPTSPTVTNMICERLDRKLSRIARKYGSNYSRYADDITFSATHHVFGESSQFLKEMRQIISEEGFRINENKTRLQQKEYRQEVTGLIVNEKVNVHREYIKHIRMYLYYWEKYGYEKAEQIFKTTYNSDGAIVSNKACLKNILAGKLEFLKMVKGYEDGTYYQLAKRFAELSGLQMPLLYNPKPQGMVVTNKNLEMIETASYPLVHNAKRTIELLKSFSKNNSSLKYITHSWEYGKFTSYEDFISKVQREWSEISKELRSLNIRLATKISFFLFNDRLGQKNEDGKYFITWGEKKLKFGWSSKELKAFMDLGNADPFYFPIPAEIRAIDKPNNFVYFKDYVAVFKNEIEIREDNNALEKILNEIWEEDLSYDFNVEQVNINGISFFTDVAYLKLALKLIFKSFSTRTQYPNIRVTLERNFGLKFVILKISQIGSNCQRSIDDPKISTPSGDLGSIINYLKNLSDFSISANFTVEDKSFRVNYLTSCDEIKKIEDIEKVEGFTFELKFYQ